MVWIDLLVCIRQLPGRKIRMVVEWVVEGKFTSLQVRSMCVARMADKVNEGTVKRGGSKHTQNQPLYSVKSALAFSCSLTMLAALPVAEGYMSASGMPMLMSEEAVVLK